jgi:hypothetical protein
MVLGNNEQKQERGEVILGIRWGKRILKSADSRHGTSAGYALNN